MKTNSFLLLGALLSAVVSAIHIVSTVFGASWYRFLGAGEQMVVWANQGDIRHVLITLSIAIVLAIWALYALSAAGAIKRLPLLKLGLGIIISIYLGRGVVGFLLLVFPEIIVQSGNSASFWVYSSLITMFIGFIYLIGTWQVWKKINQ